MADISAKAPSDTLALAELLFFAYRDFTADADAMLAQYRFGRAHHRVLHFVDRQPGLRVADLLDILRITKQSLARVLRDLVGRGFIAQVAGPADRRERRLSTTPAGAALARQLADLQDVALSRALARAGPGGATAVGGFLSALISDKSSLATADGSAK